MKSLLNFLSLMFRCLATADDKLCPFGSIQSGTGLQAAMVASGRTDSCKNIVAMFDLPFNDSLSNTPWRPCWIYTRNDPSTGNYDNIPMGSLCTQITHTAGVPTAAVLYFKTDGTTWADLTD